MIEVGQNQVEDTAERSLGQQSAEATSCCESEERHSSMSFLWFSEAELEYEKKTPKKTSTLENT